MKLLKCIPFVLTQFVCVFAQTGVEAKKPDAKPETKSVVLFVRNDSADANLNSKVKFLESAISARISGLGFAVISHDLALRNLNAYLGDANAKYKPLAAQIKPVFEGATLDMKLFESASGLRVAEMLGADFILAVSLSSYGTEKKNFSGYGINTENVIHNLRSTYTLSENGLGSGVAGAAITSTRVVRNTKDLSLESTDIMNSLIDDTANQMAQVLRQQNSTSQIVAVKTAPAEITIEFKIDEFALPEVVKDSNDNYTFTTKFAQTTIPFVTAEIDGITQNLGATITLSKGIHTLKVNQKDIAPVERNIFVTGLAGQKLSLTLSLSDEARMRWKEDLAFLEKIKERAKASDDKRLLTEAEAKRIEGIAKMFEQSGFKMDYKVDAKEFPQINKTQSIFGQ